MRQMIKYARYAHIAREAKWAPLVPITPHAAPEISIDELGTHVIHAYLRPYPYELHEEKEVSQQLTHLAPRVLEILTLAPNNMFVAGGAIVQLVTHEHSRLALRGDVDFVIYGLDADACESLKNSILALFPGARTVRSQNALTIFSGNIKYQIIMRSFKTPAAALTQFDVQCCQVLWSPALGLCATPAGAFALRNMINIMAPAFRSAAYETRLGKYAERGFRIFIPFADAPMLVASTRIEIPFNNSSIVSSGNRLMCFTSKSYDIDEIHHYDGRYYYDTPGDHRRNNLEALHAGRPDLVCMDHMCMSENDLFPDNTADDPLVARFYERREGLLSHNWAGDFMVPPTLLTRPLFGEQRMFDLAPRADATIATLLKYLDEPKARILRPCVEILRAWLRLWLGVL